MSARISPRLGGAFAMVGALGIFMGNFFHPFPPTERDAMLEMIAMEPGWSMIHLPTMFFALCVLIGLTALSDGIPDGAAGSLARIGRIVAQVGVPIMLVGVAIDGFGFKVLADQWMAAPTDERAMLARAADAIVSAEGGILNIWVATFLGLPFLAFGASQLVGTEHPRWLGVLALLGGIGCLFSGVAGFLRLPIVAPFPVFGTLILAWTFVMGVLMARRPVGRAASQRSEPFRVAPVATATMIATAWLAGV